MAQNFCNKMQEWMTEIKKAKKIKIGLDVIGRGDSCVSLSSPSSPLDMCCVFLSDSLPRSRTRTYIGELSSRLSTSQAPARTTGTGEASKQQPAERKADPRKISSPSSAPPGKKRLTLGASRQQQPHPSPSSAPKTEEKAEDGSEATTTTKETEGGELASPATQDKWMVESLGS